MWDAIIGTIEATPALAFAIGALLSGLAVSVSVVLWGGCSWKIYYQPLIRPGDKADANRQQHQT